MTMELNIYVPEPKNKEPKKNASKLPKKDFQPKKGSVKKSPLNPDSSKVVERPTKAFEKHKPQKAGSAKISKDEKAKAKGTMSSLFTKNPDVPEAEDYEVEPIQEELFSKKTFKGLNLLHPHLIGNLEQVFNITQMTMVQKLTIPVLADGKDALIQSQTGSGKTLAYALPIMQSLQNKNPKLSRNDGVNALIILPTRELALQTYECFQKLCRAFAWLVPGILVGGEKRKSEKARLRKGINILVGTPGRILDHAKNTEVLKLHNLDWLVLDEAHTLLDLNYEKDIEHLVDIIKEQREKAENVGTKQTVLLSATLTPGVERMAGLTLENPERIYCQGDDVDINAYVIPNSLKQMYVVAPAKLRLVTLASFIITICEIEGNSKVLIFMATQDMVDYYTEIIPAVITSNVAYYKLHGNMTQHDRVEVFKNFREQKSGVLLCTDVAARGLDLPMVDWIVQFTAPTEPQNYVHRVGRTARIGTKGSSLLFLIPSELPFLQWLQEKRIKLKEINMEVYLKNLLKIELESKDGQKWGSGVEAAAQVLQHNFEHAVLNEEKLHTLAAKAYQSWVRFYASYPKETRMAFNFRSLHLGHHAKCFALRDPPSTIGGIGRPAFKQYKSKAKEEKFLETSSSRTKRLITSEFDSGLPPIEKKMKT